MLNVISAKYIQGFKLFVEFDNCESREINFENYLKTEFRKTFDFLKDVNNFKNFKMQNNTICWNDEVDIAPEFLYKMVN